MILKIGVPSKGRLMEKTFEWFGTKGVHNAPNGRCARILWRDRGAR